MSDDAQNTGPQATTKVDGLYQDWFLDYASYVILERAVPLLADGMKPVQRRILHAMKEMDDGRFHKVANIIGQTMQYHPHGDASIGDALVNLGQKDLLVETQGNWGDVRTGDSAAAPRYIEARLSKFALDVLFNKETTEWQLSYDGRKNEPIALPAKFPILLAHGVEGIAVGLSTRIMPHNFLELIEGSIRVLKGKTTKLLPDFPTGGLMDAADYQRGKRGGRIKVRARIETVDKSTLRITELPYGVTTGSLIDSIIKANDKGKIKVKKVTDNTAKDVEITIDLPSGTSPDITIDALYAFTNCEVSISPNACVIIDDKPHFMTVDDMLATDTENTKRLLAWELENKKAALEETWHMSSLEKIFIEKRIYRDIEEAETWEEVMDRIDQGLHQHISTPGRTKKGAEFTLMRDVTDEDIVKLTEIKIKRISKYDSFKADEKIAKLEADLEQVKHDLAHLTDYCIAWFERLRDTYGAGRERRTEIRSFEDIEVAEVAANNVKLYVNRSEGFVGMGLKKDEPVAECSDLDDIIVFRKDGAMNIHRIDDKKFVGKNILYVGVWKKGDDRTTYHMIYADLKSGKNHVKRFHVEAAVRERDYQLTKSDRAKVLYFAAHPNGESEVVKVQLSPGCSARKKIFEYDFGDLDIKGRNAAGNILTKYPIRKVEQLELGASTIGGIDIWYDDVTGRLNTDERGTHLGEFNTGDTILAVYKDGTYEMTDFELTNRYAYDEVVAISKWRDDGVVSAIYYDGESKTHYVKRFQIETKSLDQRFPFISEHRSSRLDFLSLHPRPVAAFKVRKGKDTEAEQIALADFIDVKGWKAQGNRLTPNKVTGKIKEVTPEEEEEDGPQGETSAETEAKDEEGLKPGDSLELDL